MNVLNLFPTPLFVIKYDKPVDKELNYLKSIDYKLHFLLQFE